ncbi:MAG: GIY-YIG nuclease family protein, partial [Tepidiformaceae bacterium]
MNSLGTSSCSSQFPSHNTFRRFGAKRRFVARILEYCRSVGGFDDVISLLGAYAVLPADLRERRDTGKALEIGFVYLLKSGRYFKIGKTNAHGRRERELAIQLPEKARSVHVIKTDDPAGIEAYWHTRFAATRRHGEWFEL